MNIRIFDIECYPTYFLLCCIDYGSRKKYSFEIDENINDLNNILSFIEDKKFTNVAHNCIGYDNILLSYIIKNRFQLNKLENLEICRKIKGISDFIINKQYRDKWSEEMKPYLFLPNFNFIDTLAIMNTVDRVGIKQASINLKYHNVQELPYEPNKILTFEERENVKAYCFNDCEINYLLYERKIPDLELRKDVGKRYKLDVMNCNDTAIAKKILDKYYSEYTKQDISDFKNERSYNKDFYLKELMPVIDFKLPEFQELYKWFEKQLITEKTEIVLENEEEIKKTKIHYDVHFSDISIRFALGGVHSIDTPKKFVSDKINTITDCDFSSYYPNLLLNYKIKPRHVKDDFLTIVGTLTKERIEDKKAGRKAEADVKKIVINSIYGLLGSDFYWLKDNKALLKITVTGQLWLAKFCEELMLAGIQVISLNTDGILCLVEKINEDIYYKVCNSISKKIAIDVEYSMYKEYIRRDVNNYLSIDDKNKIKQKGKYFTTEIALNKGYYYPVIAKALNNYYISNIPIEKTIKEETDIYNFMSSQKVDVNKFTAELHMFDGKNIVKNKLQKINRWIITNLGGKFLKIEKEFIKKERVDKKIKSGKLGKNDEKTKVIGVETNNLITIVNKVESINVKDYDLNYNFYIDICNSTINLILPKTEQLSLF